MRQKVLALAILGTLSVAVTSSAIAQMGPESVSVRAVQLTNNREAFVTVPFTCLVGNHAYIHAHLFQVPSGGRGAGPAGTSITYDFRCSGTDAQFFNGSVNAYIFSSTGQRFYFGEGTASAEMRSCPSGVTDLTQCSTFNSEDVQVTLRRSRR